MNSFQEFIKQRNGLADLGNDDLSDDTAKPDPIGTQDTQHALNTPADARDLKLINKALKIAMESGEKYKNKVISLLHRMSRDLPQIQTIVHQLDDVEDEEEKKEMPKDVDKRPVVSTPMADTSPQPGGAGGGGGEGG